MRDANIQLHSKPEEVILFLEANQIKPAILIPIKSAPKNEGKHYLVTEDEIKARKIIREGVEYSFDTSTQTVLEQFKQGQNILPPNGE
jgi:hypothetical protein